MKVSAANNWIETLFVGLLMCTLCHVAKSQHVTPPTVKNESVLAVNDTTGKIINQIRHAKRAIEFPTLFYPGPDKKFITLSPRPRLPPNLLSAILVGGPGTLMPGGPDDRPGPAKPPPPRLPEVSSGNRGKHKGNSNNNFVKPIPPPSLPPPPLVMLPDGPHMKLENLPHPSKLIQKRPPPPPPPHPLPISITTPPPPPLPPRPTTPDLRDFHEARKNAERQRTSTPATRPERPRHKTPQQPSNRWKPSPVTSNVSRLQHARTPSERLSQQDSATKNHHGQEVTNDRGTAFFVKMPFTKHPFAQLHNNQEGNDFFNAHWVQSRPKNINSGASSTTFRSIQHPSPPDILFYQDISANRRNPSSLNYASLSPGPQQMSSYNLKLSDEHPRIPEPKQNNFIFNHHPHPQNDNDLPPRHQFPPDPPPPEMTNQPKPNSPIMNNEVAKFEEMGKETRLTADHHPAHVQFHSRRTSFTCGIYRSGYFADYEAGCAVFHVCHNRRQYTFDCPPGTLFSQRFLVCDWPQRVKCLPT